jgi:serine/threonine protein kinase
MDLAAEYYKRAADDGHADGANNFGFCLEHGRGVRQDIPLAAEYYKRAADRGHPEATVNYRRCLRLLSRWTIPDRSCAVSEQKPAFEKQSSAAEDRFAASLQRFAETRRSVESIDSWHFIGELGRGPLAIVKLAEDPKRKAKRAVKTLPSRMNARYFEWECSIHAKLNHPLIVGFEGSIAASQTNRAAIVTEFVPNGSLADHLPFPGNSNLSILTGGTRVAIVVAGMVFAMRYLHSRGIIHRDLKPANVPMDWGWIVCIGDLSHTLLAAECRQKSIVLRNIRSTRAMPPLNALTMNPLSKVMFSRLGSFCVNS